VRFAAKLEPLATRAGVGWPKVRRDGWTS